jgi:putative PEP-CTERM system histidine kinase
MAVTGLVIVEQLYRNTPPEQRRAIKYLCMAVGGMFAYDFYLYSDALLFQRVSASLWDARGFIHAMVVPVIGIAISRDLQWSLHKGSINLMLSRRAVFHTTALLGAGLYLLAMGAGGYYVRVYGGDWGVVAQAIFLFGAALVLAILLFSGQLRASLRVFISKHFFHYKYDYREEWLRFIRTLSSGEPETQLRERAIKAIAQIIESPGGILWMRRDDNCFEPVARWNMDVPVPVAEPADGPLVRFLEHQEWVINLDEHNQDTELKATVGAPALPDWLLSLPRAWLVVPLILHEHLLGFVILARPPRAPVEWHFNWEDCDLLKTAGRQAASHLAQLEASRALNEARQFDAFNRLSAYVVHDIKNLVAQLSLVVSNGAKHRHNPHFVDDMMRTVEHSVDKMNRLLAHLRRDGSAPSASAPVALAPLLAEVVTAGGAGKPTVVLDCHTRDLTVSADRDRLAAVIGHVIQNARDATARDGRIFVRLRPIDGRAVIEVEDTGCGMDESFIRERLFRPFQTTKGNSGMGIGMFETREYVRSIGGDVEVMSLPGRGTTVRLSLPADGKAAQAPIFKTSNS